VASIAHLWSGAEKFIFWTFSLLNFEVLLAVMDEILQPVVKRPLLPVGRQGYSDFELKILLPALDKISYLF
jgi:hypothetical protein